MIFDSDIYSFSKKKDVKLVFVHIPKTAGTSIAHILQNEFGDKDEFRHSSVAQIVEKSKINIEEYKVLAVARNVFDRIFSKIVFYNIIRFPFFISNWKLNFFETFHPMLLLFPSLSSISRLDAFSIQTQQRYRSFVVGRRSELLNF